MDLRGTHQNNFDMLPFLIEWVFFVQVSTIELQFKSALWWHTAWSMLLMQAYFSPYLEATNAGWPHETLDTIFS